MLSCKFLFLAIFLINAGIDAFHPELFMQDEQAYCHKTTLRGKGLSFVMKPLMTY